MVLGLTELVNGVPAVSWVAGLVNRGPVVLGLVGLVKGSPVVSWIDGLGKG